MCSVVHRSRECRDRVRVRVDRASDRARTPWKNGLGWMYDIASGTSPGCSSSSSDDWTWKLSTADISRDVPFSSFPNTTRKFCVADGVGVVLTINGVDVVCEPLSITTFRGDDVVFAKLIDGPLRVLNLIVKDINTSVMDIHFSVQKNFGPLRLAECCNESDACINTRFIATAIGGDAELSHLSGFNVKFGTLDSLIMTGEEGLGNAIERNMNTMEECLYSLESGIVALLSIGGLHRKMEARMSRL